MLKDAHIIIADRRRRLRGAEAVTADGGECDPCDDAAARFCAIGALIHSAFQLTGSGERAHRIGRQIAGQVAKAANLPVVDEDEPGWSLAVLSDQRGQAAVLRAIDMLIDQRRT